MRKKPNLDSSKLNSKTRMDITEYVCYVCVNVHIILSKTPVNVQSVGMVLTKLINNIESHIRTFDRCGVWNNRTIYNQGYRSRHSPADRCKL